MAQNEDVVIDQGTTFQLPFQVLQNNGCPVDLGDFILRGDLRHNFADATASASFTVTVTNESEGEAAAQLGPTLTAALTPAKYRYDIELISGSVVTRILEGFATVEPEVTK